jgi:predicted nucleic acid-binding protein
VPGGFVLDASVAVSWCFRNETTEYSSGVFERLAAETAFVPAHFQYEVANAVISAQRRGLILPNEHRAVLQPLLDLPIAVDAAEPRRVWTDVVELASNTGLTVYDAAYLELAQRLGLPLASLDVPLRQAANRLAVPLLRDQASP